MKYTISEAAAKMKLTPYTLRYYDKVGLLPFVERSSGGIRLFKEADFEWIRLIKCMKDTGMLVKDIKTFIDWYAEGDSTIHQRRDMFHERKLIVEQQIEMLKNTLDMVNYKCWFYDTAAAAGTTAAPKNIRLQDLPEEIKELKIKISYE